MAPPRTSVRKKQSSLLFLPCPPSRIRTCDRLLKRQLLYRLSYGRISLYKNLSAERKAYKRLPQNFDTEKLEREIERGYLGWKQQEGNEYRDHEEEEFGGVLKHFTVAKLDAESAEHHQSKDERCWLHPETNDEEKAANSLDRGCGCPKSAAEAGAFFVEYFSLGAVEKLIVGKKDKYAANDDPENKFSVDLVVKQIRKDA